MTHPAELAAIQALPWGSGSGFVRQGGTPGWVFCVRVADHPHPMFRFVPAEPDSHHPLALSETGTGADVPGIEQADLACLTLARPFPTEIPRTVPDSLLDNIFDAWEHAKEDIRMQWDWATDPANLFPAVPKAMRDAEELVRTNPSGELTSEQIADLSAKMLANYAPRIWRPFRHALREGTPNDQIAEIRRLVDHFALVAPTPPEALRPITADDIHLVCWMAITN